MKLPPAKETIMQISPYIGGKSSANEGVIKLSSNENPLGCSSAAREAFLGAAENLALYPDGGCTSLREKIAAAHNISESHIICGAGSDEIIQFIINAYVNVGDEIIISEHGFLMYKIYGLAAGAKILEAADDENLNADVDEILNRVSAKTKLVFLANPNNPTGGYLPKSEILRLRDGLPENVILVIDGAYAEYVDAPDYTSGLELVEAHDNIIATRTFSKIYGLAALRIGWGYAAAQVADVLNRIRGPFNVSAPAQAAAEAAVGDADFVQRSIDANNAGMDFWQDALNNLGVKFYKSYGNFVLADFEDGICAEKIVRGLAEKNIFIRDTLVYKLPTCTRITVGTSQNNERVLECLRDLL